MSDMPLAPAAVMLRYQVADFDQWKAGFDKNEANRIANGFVGHHVNRAENDPNTLAIYLAVGDVDKAKAYSDSDEVKALMKEAGLTSTPEVLWLRPSGIASSLA